jgi:hypothetical protein
MKEENIDLDKLEKAKFEIDVSAFRPKILHCSACKLKLTKTQMDIPIEDALYAVVMAFECPKCHKKYLGLEDAKRLDRAMLFKRAMSKDFKMTRNLSFDGDNYTFRIPKEFTHDVSKRKIEIIPLGAKEFCAVVE